MIIPAGSGALVRQVDSRFTLTGLALVLKRMEEELMPTQMQSLLITLGFFVLLLAVGGQHLRLFGGLTALAMVVSGLLTLLVLP